MIDVQMMDVKLGCRAAHLTSISSFEPTETHRNVLPYLNCAAVGGAISNCPEKEKKKPYHKASSSSMARHLYGGKMAA